MTYDIYQKEQYTQNILRGTVYPKMQGFQLTFHVWWLMNEL